MTRISQKSKSLMRRADTCPARGEAPAQPGRKKERPQTGHRIATGPAAGAGKAAGAEGDYTVAGRGPAARSKAARPCWVMMEIFDLIFDSILFLIFTYIPRPCETATDARQERLKDLLREKEVFERCKHRFRSASASSCPGLCHRKMLLEDALRVL